MENLIPLSTNRSPELLPCRLPWLSPRTLSSPSFRCRSQRLAEQHSCSILISCGRVLPRSYLLEYVRHPTFIWVIRDVALSPQFGVLTEMDGEGR